MNRNVSLRAAFAQLVCHDNNLYTLLLVLFWGHHSADVHGRLLRVFLGGDVGHVGPQSKMGGDGRLGATRRDSTQCLRTTYVSGGIKASKTMGRRASFQSASL